MRLHRRELIGVVLVTAAGACYASATIAIKLAYARGAGVGVTTWVRFAGSALALLALARAVRAARLPRRDRLGLLVRMGLVAAVVGWLFLGSLDRIPASTATLLLYAHPALVALATAVLGRERFTPAKGWALALSMTGLVLVLGAPIGSLDPVGAGMALGSAVALGTFVVLAQRAVVEVHPLVSSGVVQGTAAVAYAPVGLASGTHLGHLPASVGWMLAGAALTAAAISLFLAAIARLGPTRASIGATVEPVVTVALGVAILAEALSGPQLLGGALVLAAVVILPLAERRPVTATEPPPLEGLGAGD